MQTRYIDKARKYIDEALSKIKKIKSKYLNTLLFPKQFIIINAILFIHKDHIKNFFNL